jgi:hypothetical protein
MLKTIHRKEETLFSLYHNCSARRQSVGILYLNAIFGLPTANGVPVEKRRKRDFELLQVACFAEAGQLRHDVRDQAVVKKHGV